MPMLSIGDDAAAWDRFVSQAQDASVLQSWAWGVLRTRYGWGVSRYLWKEGERILAAIAVLRRRLPGGWSLHYAPRGPIVDGRVDQWPEFWAALRPQLRRQGGTVLKVDPEWSTAAGRDILVAAGGHESHHPIQHQATYIVDITGGEAALARLKASTRRNIRLGERAGLMVEASDTPAAVDVFYGLLHESATRHAFIIRPKAYYQDVVAAFAERGQAAVYLARHQGQPVAGAVMIVFGPTLVYLYGGTRLEATELKPGYLLHWRAIEDAQRRGCTRFDMWGVPLQPDPAHPGYGYYVFKSRFNGQLVRYIGMFDLPVQAVPALGFRLVERLVRTGQPEFV